MRAALVSLLLLLPTGAAGQLKVGCDAKAKPADLSSLDLASHSDDFAVEAFLGSEIVQLIRLTGIVPDIRFATADLGGPAFATPAMKGRPGTILFSDSSLGAGTMGVERLSAIAAHEFGHLLQFRRPPSTLVNALMCELHADFLGGFLLSQHPLYGAEGRMRSIILNVGEGRGTRERQRRVAMAAGVAAGAFPPDSAFVMGERVIADLVDGIVNLAARARRLQESDMDTVALAQLGEVNVATDWDVDFAGPVLELQRAYYNAGSRPIVVRVSAATTVRAADGSRHVIADRGLQQVIEPGDTAAFVVRARGDSPAIGEQLEYRITRTTAFLADVLLARFNQE